MASTTYQLTTAISSSINLDPHQVLAHKLLALGYFVNPCVVKSWDARHRKRVQGWIDNPDRRPRQAGRSRNFAPRFLERYKGRASWDIRKSEYVPKKGMIS